jgi:hypothetical protein
VRYGWDAAAGADFLNDIILDIVDNVTKKAILECDAEAYEFVLTSSVYHYVLGSKKNDAIPGFFAPETQSQISKLRKDYAAEEKSVKELSPIFTSIIAFTEILKKDDSTPARKQINAMRIAGNHSLQGLLVKECWQKAVMVELCKDFIRDQVVSKELEGKIRQKLLEHPFANDEIKKFLRIRSIYLFVFGNLRDLAIPEFFLPATQNGIQELRAKYAQNSMDYVKDSMESPEIFEKKLKERPSNPEASFMDDLIRVGNFEVSGSSLIQKCFEKCLKI